MKDFHRNFLKTLALVAVCLATGFVGLGPANAQITEGAVNRQSNVRHFTPQAVTAGQTFAVTTYADLAGSQWTFTPRRYATTPDTPGVNVPSDRMVVIASLDVSKATGTTGSCSIYANGAVIAASERFQAFAAGRGTITLVGHIVSTVATGTQVVKVQCHSADTSTFTVNTGQVYLEELY